MFNVVKHLPPHPICLGTAIFGADLPEDQSFEVMDAYANAGGNQIDTAHIYGSWMPGKEGASERTVGKWLTQSGKRDAFYLATKGGNPPLERFTDPARFSLEELNQDLSESLERLQCDFVDLYWLHRDNEAVPVPAILDVVAQLLASGRIGAYGLSNWSHLRLQAAIDYADAQGLPRPAASQIGCSCAVYAKPEPPLYGMRHTRPEDLAWHTTSQLPLVAYTSQAAGWFGEENVAWAAGGFSGPAPKGEHYESESNRQRLQACIALAREKSVTANQMALAWLLQRPYPVTPIIGNSKPARIHEAMEVTNLTLSPEECARIAPE